MDKDDVAAGGRKVSGKGAAPEKPVEKRDFSLKEGETITINIGGKGRRSKDGSSSGFPSSNSSSGSALFSIPPPPSSGGVPFLPPPPSAQDIKAQKRLSQQAPPEPSSMADLGFDDGEFGEFQ